MCRPPGGISKSRGMQICMRCGTTCTVAELSTHLGVSEEDILEGLESASAYSTMSLDAGTEGDDDGPPAMLDTLGIDDAALEGVEYRESLKPLLAALPPRERHIIALRFFHTPFEMTIFADGRAIIKGTTDPGVARSLYARFVGN